MYRLLKNDFKRIEKRIWVKIGINNVLAYLYGGISRDIFPAGSEFGLYHMTESDKKIISIRF